MSTDQVPKESVAHLQFQLATALNRAETSRKISTYLKNGYLKQEIAALDLGRNARLQPLILLYKQNWDTTIESIVKCLPRAQTEHDTSLSVPKAWHDVAEKHEAGSSGVKPDAFIQLVAQMVLRVVERHKANSPESFPRGDFSRVHHLRIVATMFLEAFYEVYFASKGVFSPVLVDLFSRLMIVSRLMEDAKVPEEIRRIMTEVKEKMEQEIALLREEIKDKDMEILKFKATQETKEQEILEFKETQETQEQEIALLRKKSKDKDSEILKFEETQKTKEQEIVLLRQESKDKDIEISKLKKEMKKVEGMLQRARIDEAEA